MPIVTHQYPLAEYDRAFATMESGESGKVMMWVT
jgi:threonine dehydrogenase-like Zn-dependent dehydrogenase